MTNATTNIKEFILSGEKLPKPTNDLDLIAKTSDELYNKNREFIKEKIEDNWFVIVEPVSGSLIASPNQLELFKYGKKRFPDRLFHSIGLLKDNFLYYDR